MELRASVVNDVQGVNWIEGRLLAAYDEAV